MTTQERVALHERCFPHEATHCPLEAAYSAYADDRSLRLNVAVYLVIIAAVVIVCAGFPHAKLYNPWTQADDPLPVFVAFVATVAVCFSAALFVPRLLRERRQNHEIAARGPTCNPWAGLEEDPRSRWPAMLSANVRSVLWLIGLHGTAEAKRPS